METSSEYSLANDVSLIGPLTRRLQRRLEMLPGCDPADTMRVAMALCEALINAMEHGNLEVGSSLRETDPEAHEELLRARASQEPYCNRRVRVSTLETRDAARFVITDEGPGFDPNTLPDPTDPANLERLSGRGLLLIRSFMDEVSFSPSGNSITLVKRC